MENPYLGSPSPAQAEAWSTGFFRAFADPLTPLEPPADVDPDDAAPYGEGVQAGVQSAIEGIGVTGGCIAASESDHSEWTSKAWTAWSIGAMVAGPSGLAAMAARGLITLLRYSLHTVNTVPPGQVLSGLADPLLEALQRYGVESLVLYMGVGRDALATGCEFQTTAMFPEYDAARAAVETLGRPDWLLVSWRTDQSGSFAVVEYSE